MCIDNMDINMKLMDDAGISHVVYFQDDTNYLNLDHLNMDTMSLIKTFVGGDEYISVAPMSKDWKNVWGSSPKMTRAINGHTSRMKLHLFIATRTSNTLYINDIARGGRLDFVKFHWDPSVAKEAAISAGVSAAVGGHVHVLEWIREWTRDNKFEDDEDEFEFDEFEFDEFDAIVSSAASTAGMFDVVKWIWEQKMDTEDDMDSFYVHTCVGASRGGHLGIFKWCLENGTENQLDGMCEYDFDIYQSVADTAAAGGYLEFLKYAVQHSVYPDVNTCSAAASGGHLDVLEWLIESGCEWDGDTCTKAIAGKHWEVLAWARENGCPE